MSAFTGIPSDEVATVWPLVEERVCRGLARSYGEYEAHDILAALLDSGMQLWVADSAVLVTQILKYPRKSVCWLVLCGGEDMDAWVRYMAVIEAWARSLGCAEVRAYGREGWARVLGPHGFERGYSVVRKEL